jgi:hypothetical protein
VRDVFKSTAYVLKVWGMRQVALGSFDRLRGASIGRILEINHG